MYGSKRFVIPFFSLFLTACSGAAIIGGEEVRDAGVDVSDTGAADSDAAGSSCASHCNVGEVCEGDRCHKDCGAGGIRCSSPEVCCAAGDVCHLGVCTKAGASCVPNGSGTACKPAACPDKNYCEPSINKCLPLAPPGMCDYRPPIETFSPKVKWGWQGSAIMPTYNQVMMTPVVADLDGDCMPDVVFATFAGSNYYKDGVLRAVRGDGTKELWTVTDSNLRSQPGGQIALADVDNDAKVEVFTCHESGALMALNYDGSKKWLSTDKPCIGNDAPFIADLNHDGVPEVVVGFTVHNAQTGVRIGTPPAANGYSYTTAAEMDGNTANGMEIVGGGIVYHQDGSLYWNANHGAGFPAVADLNGDGLPDVVSVVSTKSAGAHSVYAYKHDGTLLWGPKDVNNGVAPFFDAYGGGPPTIADFNGDGQPDVAVAGGYGYLVLNGQTGTVLWQAKGTSDLSSRITGSSVFDFEGDGQAEVVYNDERNLRVYKGKDGTELVKLCSTSGTLYENPVVVDVDADDHADIVVMSNNYTINTCDSGGASQTGFRVIGDAGNRWVRTRRIWNQHTYHVTNINDDGTVPRNEDNHWQKDGLNNFRQNVQTTNVHAAPDLVPLDLSMTADLCPKELRLFTTVFNQGAATAMAPVPVTFYAVDRAGVSKVIATVFTTGPILAGGTQRLSINWHPTTGSTAGPYQVRVAVDDDGKAAGGINECNETNNLSTLLTVGCTIIG